MANLMYLTERTNSSTINFGCTTLDSKSQLCMVKTFYLLETDGTDLVSYYLEDYLCENRESKSAQKVWSARVRLHRVQFGRVTHGPTIGGSSAAETSNAAEIGTRSANYVKHSLKG